MTISASARLLCRQTPLVFAPALGAWLKLESLQRTGSFKLRGAAATLGALTDEERARGVVAASAGNHGLGVACAAQALGMAATIVVPSSAPENKRRGIAAYGATLIVHGDRYEAAEVEARRIAAVEGALFLSPFDDERVIAGNGRWLAHELFAQRPSIARVIVPVGGGGLIAGFVDELSPHGVEVIGAQPSANCAMHESLRLGRALTTYDGGETICEGLEGPVAERTFQRVRHQRVPIVLVEESEVRAAVAFAYRTLGLRVESSAAVGIAALRTERVPLRSETALVITGGNIDDAELDRALADF